MRKQIEEMLGDFLRDAAVLVLVFALLDKVMAQRLTLWWVCGTIAISGLLLILGILLERWRLL